MNTTQEDLLVPTREAAKIFGVSAYTLKKYGHPETGFLKEGKHWKRGMTRTSSRGWRIEACKQALQEQGFIFFNCSKK